MMSPERALVDFYLEFSKYIWFLLPISRSKSTTRASNHSTQRTVITPEGFHLPLSLGQLPHLIIYTLTQGGMIFLLPTCDLNT